MLTPPTLAELAASAGRTEAEFGTFATQALDEVTFMFEEVTGITEWPTDANQLKLAKLGVLKMADVCYLQNLNRERTGSGLQSETTANYSYTLAQKAAYSGKETGVWWWDRAVAEFTIASESRVASRSISVFERGLRTHHGRRIIENPANRHGSRHTHFGDFGDHYHG